MEVIVLKIIDFPEHTGLGYFQRCLERAIPDAIIKFSLSEEDLVEHNIIIVPRSFFTPDPLVHPHYELIGQLEKVRGYIIQSVLWDFGLTKQILPLLGRAHLFHTPSKFIAKILSPYPTKVIPLPVKGIFQKKEKEGRSFRVGGVVTPHPRKNHQGWIQLAGLLKKHRVTLVADASSSKIPIYKELQDAGIEVVYDLTDDEMLEFYLSLDWFVSLSVGEGYGLPVREALACGTPVIVPKHTGYLDLEGVDGVRFVNCFVGSGKPYHVPDTFVYLPDIKEIARIINDEIPPKVDYTPFRWSDWVSSWHKLKEQVTMKITQKSVWVKEVPCYFALTNDSIGGGLNRVSRIWARRANAETFLYPSIPTGATSPIIIPYHEALPTYYTPHLFTKWLTELKTKVKSPVIVWLHHELSVASSLRPILMEIADAFAYTHPQAAQIYNSLYLPLPIGNGKNPNTQEGEHFLIWGFNPLLLKYAIDIANLLGVEYKVLCANHISWNEGVVKVLEELFDPKRCIFLPHISDEELERYLDNARGYVICDTDGQLFEVGARLPDVLRKGKPIIANRTKRNELYSNYVTLIPLQGYDLLSITYFALTVKKIGFEELRPRGVPPIEQEMKFLMSFIERAHSLRH